jgi:hypothetical protein
MMRPYLLSLLLLPLLASGCAAQGNSVQAQCQRTANNNPEVQDLLAKKAGSGTPIGQSIFDPGPARQAAYLSCMRARAGLPEEGGVEPVRHPDTTFQLF